jgi:hypothetical protein
MKSAALIVFALFIDGAQAALSAGLFVISAFPGTFGGGALGCAGGAAVAGDIGCAIGGFLLGVFGSIPLINGALAVVTVPVGVMLGFAVSICLAVTLGAGLITLLIFNGMFYPKYLLPGGISEFIPGVSLIPAWTAIVIFSALQKNKDEKLALLEQAARPEAGSENSSVRMQTNIPPKNSIDGIVRYEKPSVPANENTRAERPRYAA